MIVDFFGCLFGLLFLGVLLWNVAQLDIEAIRLGIMTSTPARMPEAVPYTVMLIGIVLFILEVFRQAINLSNSLRSHEKGGNL